MTWQKVKLGEICQSITDGDHQSIKKVASGVPIIKIKFIDSVGHLNLSEAQYASEEYYNRLSEDRKAKKGDILYSVVGTIGKTLLVKDNKRFVFDRDFAILRVKDEKVIPEYLYYEMTSFPFYMQAYNLSRGAAQLHLFLSTIKRLEIFLPPLKVQRKIVDILLNYDDLIANCKKEIGLLEEAAQRIYREWFVNFRFPGHVIGSPLSEPAEKESATFTDGIPDGWQETTLGEIAPFKKGKVVTKSSIGEGNIPVIAGGLGPAYYTDKSNTSNRVITISASGANAGFTRMYFEPIWASDCSFIDSSTTNEIFFVYCFLKNNIKAINNLQKGSAQPHVYAKDVNALAILCPTQEMMSKFTRLVTPYFDSIAQNEKRISLLTEARDRLLPKLMTGEIDVEQLSLIQ